MNYSVLFRRFKSYRYIGANVASVFGVEHQTKLALDEDLFFINVDNKIEKLLIASDDGIAVVAHRPATDDDTSVILNPLSAPVSSLDTINE